MIIATVVVFPTQSREGWHQLKGLTLYKHLAFGSSQTLEQLANMVRLWQSLASPSRQLHRHHQPLQQSVLNPPSNSAHLLFLHACLNILTLVQLYEVQESVLQRLGVLEAQHASQLPLPSAPLAPPPRARVSHRKESHPQRCDPPFKREIAHSARG